LEGRGKSTLATVAWGNLLCAGLALMLYEFWNPDLWHLGLADLGGLLWLGFFQIGLAYWLVSKALRHVPAFEASLLFLVEPVFNPLWAWLVQGEVPGGIALLGGGIILGCALHASFNRAQSESSSPSPR